MSGINHDGGAFTASRSSIVATWPVGTFVENLAIDARGDIFASIHTESRVVRITPETGEVAAFASFPTPVAGLVLDASGTLWVSGGTPGTAPGVIYKVSPDGAVETWCELPHALFLNGMTLHPDGRPLVAESLLGQILAVDLARPGASIWLQHELLAPRAIGQTPGANGIKIMGEHAYVTVTERDIVTRAKIETGGSAGELETIAQHLRADDFAIGADHGLYIATHPMNSLVRLFPRLTRTTLAGADQGLAGATSVAFGRGAADANCVYVTTTGGMFAPIDGAVQPARLVRVETETTALA